MTVLAWVAMALAGGCGAVARYALTEAFVRHGHTAPAAIFAVNISGALAIGLLAGAGLDGDARLILATGFLGGYTTFSTWMVQTTDLAGEGRVAWAAANLLGSLAVGFGAVALGVALG